ncbi:MAG: Ig-like domain-containing protein [Acidobacteriia bacterium]|nr:Ig-like domain-containing protein [Terriglobia bacterium]
MSYRNFSRAVFVCLAAVSATFAQQNQGQEYLFQFAIQPNTFTQFSAYIADANPLATFSPGTGPSGVGAIIPTVDGNKFYLLGSGGPGALESADATLSNFHTINGLGIAPTAGAVTPDGKYFLVAADGFYVIDTSNDAILTQGGLSLPGTATFAADEQPGYCASCWIAVTHDSQFAFVLTNSAFGSQVTAINLATHQRIGMQLNLTGDATSISLSPTGTLYVAATNVIYYFNPSILTGAAAGSPPQTCQQLNQNSATTLCNQIQVFAEPLALHFDPQGLYAYFANRAGGISGQSLFQVNLQTGIAISWPAQGSGITAPRFTDVFVASNGRLFAYAPDIQTLWDVSANPFVATLDAPSLGLPRATVENVTTVAISNELPNAHWLFLLVTNGNQTNLYRMDLTSNTVSQQTLSAFNGGVMQFASVPVQTGAAQFINYNDGQHLSNGTTSLPLVARVLDASGKRVYSSAATFTTDASTGLVITTPNGTTNANGLVQTTVTVPANGATCPLGVCTVTLTVGGATDTFTINVPTSSTGGCGGGGGGGGGGTGGSGMIIVSGDGQLVRSGFGITGPPLVVQVNDANGKPLPGVPVTFSVSSGPLGIDTTDATTDQNGQAKAGLRSTSVTATFPGYFPSAITASSQYGSVTFTATVFVTTALGGADIPASFVVTPDAGTPLVITAGQTIANGIVAQIYSQTSLCPGCPIPGVGLTLYDATNPTGDPAGAQPPIACQGSTLSDTTGSAHCNVVTTGCRTGNFQVAVLVGGFEEHDIAVQVGPGPQGVSATVISGNGQNGSPGQTLSSPLVAQVLDGCGNPVAGATVSWSVSPANSATLKNTINQADGTGKVSTSLAFGNTPGTITVTLTLASNNTVKFTLTNKILLGSISLVSGASQTAVTGQAFAQPVIFVAKDTTGNPVQGATVNFAVSSGVATVTPTSATTDAQGRVQTTVTAGAQAGNIIITASSSGFSATASLTSIPPGPSITASSFTNTASGAIGLVACGLATVTGNGVAPNVQGVISSSLFGPLPYSLGPISALTVNGTPAPIDSVSNQNGVQQATFQVPCEVTGSSATVVLTVSGGATTISGVQVLPAQPGIFTYLGPNSKPYGAVIRAADGTYVTPSSFAHRGEPYYAVLTGLGQTTPPASTDNPGNSQAINGQAIVGVNNQGVPVGSSYYLPGAIGVYLIQFTIPLDGPSGTDVPFSVGVIVSGQVYYSNSVYLPGVN